MEASGARHVVRREEVVIAHEDPPGWIMEREAGWSVALDLAIDDELRDEGFAREIINKIQFMRKKGGLRRHRSHRGLVRGNGRCAARSSDTATLIRGETQAERITTGKGPGRRWRNGRSTGSRRVLCLKRI